MKKSILKDLLTVGLVVSLTAGLAITGTVAYLTDRDSEANIFTVGNVEIDLTEDFEQGAALIPGMDIKKEPTITNTGKNDAWVWMTIAVPSALDHDDASQNVLHFNYSKDSVGEGFWNWKNAEGNWAVEEVEIDGVKYNAYTVKYETALKPGETTVYPAMTKVYVDPHVDIDPNGDWYHVLNGDVTGPYWNSDEDGTPIIYVSAYAMQTEGFATVEEAYAAYNKQWTTTENVNNGLEYAGVTIASPESEAVRPAGYEIPENGGVIDGITVIDNSDDVTNLRALYREGGITDSLTVKNSVLDGTYAMNVTTKNSEAVLTCEDTTFMGWVSYSGFASASFTDCTFKINSEATYNVVRPYDVTIFANCEFKGTELWLDNLADGETITLENCTYNGETITREILETMVKAGSANSVVLK